MVMEGVILDVQGHPIERKTTENTPNLSDLQTKIAQLEAQIKNIGTVKKVRRLNKGYSTQIKDLKTGITYPSKSQLGYALLGKAAGSWAGQTLITEHPERFVAVGQIPRKPFEKVTVPVVPAVTSPAASEKPAETPVVSEVAPDATQEVTK